MVFFNAQGQLNASNLKDALQSIVRFASLLEDNQSSNTYFSSQPNFNEAKRDDIIAKAISTQEGKVALAQAMANPIRRNLDYQGIARRTLVVDPLPQGALPVYDRDIDVAAVVVSSNGGAPQSQVYSDRVTVAELEIVCNPTARIHEVRRRRFNLIDRAVQKARQEIMAQEDANIFAALDTASTIENSLVTLDSSGITKANLLSIKAAIDDHDLVTDK